MIIEYKSHHHKNKMIELNTYKAPYVLQEREGLNGLSVDIKTFRSVAQAGVSVQANLIRERIVSIRGAIVYDGQLEREKLKQNIYSVFNPAFTGDLRIITDNNTEFNLKNVYIEEAPVFEEKLNGPDIEFFNITFTCPEPFLLSKEKKVSLQNETGTWEFDWEILREGVTLSTIDSNAIQNAYNAGDVETPIKVVIRSRGHMVDPYLINLTKNEAIAVNYTMKAGERIEITTGYGNKKVFHFDKDGNKTDIFKHIDLNTSFFSLGVGDNLIKYGTKRSVENMTVDIYYSDRFLGV